MSDEDLEYAKKLLRIVNVIENYNYYLIRRSIGLIFIVIIALTAIIIATINMIEQALNLSLFLSGMLYFSAFSLFFLVITILSHNIAKIPEIYSAKRMNYRNYGGIWMIAGIMILVSSVIIYNTYIPDIYFTFLLQVLFGVGFLGSYFTAKNDPDYPGKVKEEYLILGLVLILLSPLILLYPKYAWITAFTVVMIGTFIFGIYLILTASKVFEKWENKNGSENT